MIKWTLLFYHRIIYCTAMCVGLTCIAFITTFADFETSVKLPLPAGPIISQLITKLKSHPKNLDFIRKLSESQITETVNIFGIPSLGSSILKRQFLACSGVRLLKRTVSFNDEGKITVPKHFQTCKNMTFQKTGNIVALLSWPGSGNSWVRELIETTTGIYTGAYKDCDSSYISVGMFGEGVYTKNVIVMKIHFPPPNWKLPNKIIYIVRNPFDSIIADWNRKYSVLQNPLTAHISTTRKENFGSKNPRWTREVRTVPLSWRYHIQKWVGSKKVPTLVIQYEKLLTNLYIELKRIVEFLEVSYAEEDLQCTIRSSTEQFHRSHDKSFDPYTKEQKLWILKQIQLANKILQPYNITFGSKQ